MNINKGFLFRASRLDWENTVGLQMEGGRAVEIAVIRQNFSAYEEAKVLRVYRN